MSKIKIDNIVQYHSKSNNCFQDVIGMILTNNGIDPLNMYVGCLNFGYSKQRKLYGERITPSRDGRWLDSTITNSVYETVGMVLQKKQNSSLTDIKRVLCKSKQGIVIEVDVFNCKWHIFYKKIHSIHYCWLIDIDDNKFVFALPFGEKIGYYNAELNSTYNYYTYCFVEKNKKRDVLDIISKAYVECMGKNNITSDLEQMNMFRNDVLLKGIALDEERENYLEIVNIPLVRAFEWILWSRMNFHDMLIKFDEKCNYKTIVSELAKAIDIWKGIKNFVIIEFMRGSKFLNNNLAKYLAEAIDQEKRVLKAMENVVGNRI